MARYQRESKIDSGGFGCVYRAQRVDDGEIVAFKVLEGDTIIDEDRTRFVREVRIQSRLDHPQIVPVLGSNLTVDPPFFVMPLADGNLRAKMCGDGFPGGLKATISVFMQLVDGVAYAHSNGVIHRDLKPENILFFDEDIFGDEMVRISDFGLGKRMDMESLTVTQSYVGMGTAAYMAPEQYRDFKRKAANEPDGDAGQLVLHQDAFAAGYDDDEYTLLGMAVKYAGLKGVVLSITGKNHETF